MALAKLAQLEAENAQLVSHRVRYQVSLLLRDSLRNLKVRLPHKRLRAVENALFSPAAKVILNQDLELIRRILKDTNGCHLDLLRGESVHDKTLQIIYDSLWLSREDELDVKRQVLEIQKRSDSMLSVCKALANQEFIRLAKEKERISNHNRKILIYAFLVVVLIVVSLLFAQWYHASMRRTLYSFSGSSSGFPPVPVIESSVNEREKAVFHEVQLAWSRGSMLPIAYLMSDGVRSSLQSGLNLLSRQGLRNEISDIKIYSVKVLGEFSSDNWESREILFNVSATDRYFTIASQKKIKESTSNFAEVWTFIRKKSSSASKLGLNSRTCPNCGADVDFSKSPLCLACGSLRNSGLHDWVLSRITQSSEYFASRVISDFQQSSKTSFPMEQILVEDRASSLFWRYVEARLDSNNSDWKTKFAGLLVDNPNDENLKSITIFIKGFAVGSVRCEKLEAQENGNLAVIAIQYSCIESNISSPHRVIMTLIQMGSNTGSFDLASMSCRGCGASRGFKPHCEYCSKIWPSPVGEWLLKSITE